MTKLGDEREGARATANTADRATYRVVEGARLLGVGTNQMYEAIKRPPLSRMVVSIGRSKLILKRPFDAFLNGDAT